jgi:hypothetical protein
LLRHGRLLLYACLQNPPSKRREKKERKGESMPEANSRQAKYKAGQPNEKSFDRP